MMVICKCIESRTCMNEYPCDHSVPHYRHPDCSIPQCVGGKDSGCVAIVEMPQELFEL